MCCECLFTSKTSCNLHLQFLSQHWVFLHLFGTKIESDVINDSGSSVVGWGQHSSEAGCGYRVKEVLDCSGSTAGKDHTGTQTANHVFVGFSFCFIYFLWTETSSSFSLTFFHNGLLWIFLQTGVQVNLTVLIRLNLTFIMMNSRKKVKTLNLSSTCGSINIFIFIYLYFWIHDVPLALFKID